MTPKEWAAKVECSHLSDGYEMCRICAADAIAAAVQAEREVCIQMFTKIKAGIPLEDIIDAIRGEPRTAQEEGGKPG